MFFNSNELLRSLKHVITITLQIRYMGCYRKILLESERLKVVANLQKYHDKRRSWRDLKVKKREFDVGNLVLLRSPHTESSGKLESK
jgi:hypothetical protein